MRSPDDQAGRPHRIEIPDDAGVALRLVKALEERGEMNAAEVAEWRRGIAGLPPLREVGLTRPPSA